MFFVFHFSLCLEDHILVFFSYLYEISLLPFIQILSATNYINPLFFIDVSNRWTNFLNTGPKMTTTATERIGIIAMTDKSKTSAGSYMPKQISRMAPMQ